MRRFGWIAGALVMVAMLVAIEVTIISNASGYEAKEQAVFAKVRIEENTVITGAMVEAREVSRDAVHPSALKNTDGAVSMRAGMTIEAGEMILKSKLTSESNRGIKAENSNNRLFSLEMKADQANAWQFSQGQHVDIIYVPNHGEGQIQPPDAVGIEKPVPLSTGVRVLKDVRVAGLINGDGQQVEPEGAKDADPDNIPKYVCVEVTREQAVFLAYAKSSGKLELCCIPEE